MVFDSISYKAVISNGLVLDKNGNKMSKRLEMCIRDRYQSMEQFGICILLIISTLLPTVIYA